MPSTAVPPVAKKKPSPSEDQPVRDRVDLRAPPDWIARVERQAKRRGISLSAYIRQATSLMVDDDENKERQQKG